MKHLLSPLTIATLSVLVFLVTVKREGAIERHQTRNEIRLQQTTVETRIFSSPVTAQDSLAGNMSLMMLPLKDGRPAGKSMNLLIY